MAGQRRRRWGEEVKDDEEAREASTAAVDGMVFTVRGGTSI